jgi:periplasmic protein TonB
MTSGYLGSSFRQRGLATLAVGGIHAGLGFALVAAMPGVAMQPIRERTVTGIALNANAYGGDPATSEGIPDHVIVHRLDPSPPLDWPRPPDIVDGGCILTEPPEFYPGDIGLLAPSYDGGRPPLPITDKAAWLTTDDLPLDESASGDDWMSYSLTIGIDGRVMGCSIVRASASPRFDGAICRALAARARFAPALDRNGEKMLGFYAGTVRWEFPKSEPAPPQEPG